MKNIWYYLQWRWAKTDVWDRVWWAGMAAILISWFVPHPYDFTLSSVALIMIFSGLLKLFWHMQVHDYRKYEQEKQRILDILKE
jgi:hypothetical protein